MKYTLLVGINTKVNGAYQDIQVGESNLEGVDAVTVERMIENGMVKRNPVAAPKALEPVKSKDK